MKYYMTEEEAVYMQAYQGHFSRNLAAWAIGNMEYKDEVTGRMKQVSVRSIDDVMEILKDNDVKISQESIYDAWYLYHMCIADYQKSIPTDKQRSQYIEETICDPDGEPTNVLACFMAKMCNKDVPIYWEMFM